MKKQLLALLIVALSSTTLFQPVHAGPVKTTARIIGRLIHMGFGATLVAGGGVIVLLPWKHSNPSIESILGCLILGGPILLGGAVITENGFEKLMKIINKKHKPKHHHHHTEKVDVVVHAK